MKTLRLLLIIITGIEGASAQIRADFIPMAGHPFILPGKNHATYNSVTGRLQVSYKERISSFQPFIALSVSGMQLPLRNRSLENLSMAVLNTAFAIGLNKDIGSDDEQQWTLGAGIGLCRLKPDGATLIMEGVDNFTGFTAVENNSWFPQTELSGRWVHYLQAKPNYYFGFTAIATFLWLRGNKVLYTTTISGTSYNLSFGNFAIWPSLGGVIGWRF